MGVNTPSGTSSTGSVLSFPTTIPEAHTKPFEPGVIPAPYTPGA